MSLPTRPRIFLLIYVMCCSLRDPGLVSRCHRSLKAKHSNYHSGPTAHYGHCVHRIWRDLVPTMPGSLLFPLKSGSLIPLQPLPLSFPAYRKQPRRAFQEGLRTLHSGILLALLGSAVKVWLCMLCRIDPRTFLTS